jgi:hypothetical protein
VVYRVGAPIRPADAVAWQPRGSFEPFTAEAESAHRDTFQAFVDQVMGRIDELLDERHRVASGDPAAAVHGARRFV